MDKSAPPKLFVQAVLRRSIVNVQVGALIVDRKGRYIQWAWNSVGSGLGLHAEVHAISRSSRRRLKGSTILVAGRWKKSGNLVTAKPCPACMAVIKAVGLAKVIYQTKTGTWEELSV